MDKVKPHLVKFWNLIKGNDQQAINVLNTFWFYLPLETLEYILNRVNAIPEAKSPEYILTYEVNDFAYDHDAIIELLGDFLRSTEYLKYALELATEYVKREPVHLPELIHKILEKLTYDWRDERTGFFRQETLIDF
ncbi:hypothetical protein [Pedobacter steynii]